MQHLTEAWSMYVDGASRGNPGPSGIGVVIYHHGKPVIKRGYAVGTRTNNQAEYLALIIGLMLLRYKLSPTESSPLVVHIMADSQLLVRQLTGEYSVKNKDLKQLYDTVQKLLDGFRPRLIHVVREHNTIADELANNGIDQNKTPPAALSQLLATYNIQGFHT